MFSDILFDLDGTLTDPREGITKCVQSALSQMGIEEPDRSRLEHFIGPPLRTEFMRCYGFTAEQAETATAAYRVRFAERGWRENLLLDGVPELLDALKRSGRRLAVASSKPGVFVDKILELFELTRYFDAVAGATLDGAVSTKHEVVERALHMLHTTDRACAVLVGDRKHDVAGAKESGIASIGVTFGFGGREELCAAGADWVVDSMQELQGLLLRG